MMALLTILICAALIALWYFLAREMSKAAQDKGYDARRYFHICFWLGLPGFLIVMALPDLIARQQTQTLISALEQKGESAPAADGGWQLPPL